MFVYATAINFKVNRVKNMFGNFENQIIVYAGPVEIVGS